MPSEMKSLREVNSPLCNRSSVTTPVNEPSSSSSSSINEPINNQMTSLMRDGGRSAFSPYRPSTVLTNLQRGNVQTQTSTVVPERTVHQCAAVGELFAQQLEGIDIDEIDESGFTPLLWAASYGQLSTVKLLLSSGANASIRGNNGETALLLAATNGHVHIVKQLIANGVDVNAIDEDGNSALMYAAFGNHALCTNELLKANADFTLQNSNLDTAFSIAVKKRSKQVQMLLEKHIVSLLML